MTSPAFVLEEVLWTATVPGLPSEDRKRRYWDQAVPALADLAIPRTTASCIVVAQVSAPAPAGRPPGGPRGRAKCLLDALHDDRKSGPYYRDLGVPPPLADDGPGHIAGLAVEVHVAHRTEVTYAVGLGLRVRGRLHRSLDVDVPAPNDVAGNPAEGERIARARLQFARATAEAWDAVVTPDVRVTPSAVVVHHHPTRDEDNTWSTWGTSLFGTANAGNDHWAANAPLKGGEPCAFASLADRRLPVSTRYEIYVPSTTGK